MNLHERYKISEVVLEWLPVYHEHPVNFRLWISGLDFEHLGSACFFSNSFNMNPLIRNWISDPFESSDLGWKIFKFIFLLHRSAWAVNSKKWTESVVTFWLLDFPFLCNCFSEITLLRIGFSRPKNEFIFKRTYDSFMSHISFKFYVLQFKLWQFQMKYGFLNWTPVNRFRDPIGSLIF